MNMEEDHIHMLINCTPQHYIPNIIKAMKGVSARLLMKEFGDDIERTKKMGMDEHFSKLLAMEKVIEAIGNYLKK